MLTKGIIVGRVNDDNTYLVRIPLLENIGDATQSVLVATLSYTSGIVESLKKDDVVEIGFEEHSPDNPVIIGKLFLNEDITESRGFANLESLKVRDNVSLPNTTTIGGKEISAQYFNAIDDRLDELTSENISVDDYKIKFAKVYGSSYDYTGNDANTTGIYWCYGVCQHQKSINQFITYGWSSSSGIPPIVDTLFANLGTYYNNSFSSIPAGFLLTTAGVTQVDYSLSYTSDAVNGQFTVPANIYTHNLTLYRYPSENAYDDTYGDKSGLTFIITCTLKTPYAKRISNFRELNEALAQTEYYYPNHIGNPQSNGEKYFCNWSYLISGSAVASARGLGSVDIYSSSKFYQNQILGMIPAQGILSVGNYNNSGYTTYHVMGIGGVYDSGGVEETPIAFLLPPTADYYITYNYSGGIDLQFFRLRGYNDTYGYLYDESKPNSFTISDIVY